MPAVALTSIVIGERVRKDMGDLHSLAESMKRHGLLHPVVVKTDGTLVAGHRRLEAARINGWTEIQATRIDVDDLLSAERDENAERKNFSPTEAVEIGRQIEELHRAKIDAQETERKKSGSTTTVKQLSGQDPVGQTREIAGRAVGMGGSKYAKARAVVTAAESEPERFGDLPEQMDATGNVSAAHREMTRRKGSGQIRHPVHNRTHYPKPNREVERATFSLDGICTCLKAIEPSELDAGKTKAWAKALKKSAAIIAQFARRLENVKR